MTRAPKLTRPVVKTALLATDADGNEIVQIKVWLLGISPMVWRRVLVPSACTRRELHGVIQVAGNGFTLPAPVSEPPSVWVLGLGFVGLAALQQRCSAR